MASDANFEVVEAAVHAAIDELFRDEANLFDLDANERTISPKLAEKLVKYFPGWKVDCEYNRHGREKKTINGNAVFPDIIVHRRGKRKENLLVIEVKKSSSSSRLIAKDKKKVQAFCGPEFGYRYGLAVAFSTGSTSKISAVGAWYELGGQFRGTLKRSS